MNKRLVSLIILLITLCLSACNNEGNLTPISKDNETEVTLPYEDDNAGISFSDAVKHSPLYRNSSEITYNRYLTGTVTVNDKVLNVNIFITDEYTNMMKMVQYVECTDNNGNLYCTCVKGMNMYFKYRIQNDSTIEEDTVKLSMLKNMSEDSEYEDESLYIFDLDFLDITTGFGYEEIGIKKVDNNQYYVVKNNTNVGDVLFYFDSDQKDVHRIEGEYFEFDIVDLDDTDFISEYFDDAREIDANELHNKISLAKELFNSNLNNVN